jgi:hypothetical protein
MHFPVTPLDNKLATYILNLATYVPYLCAYASKLSVDAP